MTSGDRAAEPPGNPDADPHLATPRRRRRTHQWDVLGAVAAGGVLGAEARYALGLAIPHTAGQWPWSTLLINASGCLAIGVLMVVITDLVTPHRLLRPFIGIGVLGGYTTFSTYSVEIVQLLGSGRPGSAMGYLLVTPVVAMVAVWVGAVATRAASRLRVGRMRGVAG